MALLQHAAPKPQKIRLPSLFVGSQRLFEPKPTAANFYSAPASGIPKPVTLNAAPTVVPSQPDVDAAQSQINTTTGGGTSVDFGALVRDDAFLKRQAEAIETQRKAAEDAAIEAERRAIAQFGYVPKDQFGNNITLPGGVTLDQATIDLMNSFTETGVSTWARINKAYNDAQSQFLSSLAARGMLRSGELGQRQGEVGLGREQSRFTATNELMDYMRSLWQTYLGQLASGQQALADATRETIQRLMSQIQGTVGGGGGGTPPYSGPPINPQSGWPEAGTPWAGTELPSNIGDYPHLNPAAPEQVYTPVYTGSSGQFEPKPWTGNMIPGPDPARSIDPSTGLPYYIDTGAPTRQVGPWNQYGYTEKPWWWDSFEQFGWEQTNPPAPGSTGQAIANQAADYTRAPGSSPVPGEDEYFQSQLGNYGGKPLW